MKFSIYDEDGFLGLIDAATYKGFVDEDWSLPQLLTHFVSQMNGQSLVIWQTNNIGGGAWEVEILSKPSIKKAFRAFSHTIQVTSGLLYLTTYTDLTMAAQFADEPLPSKQNAGLEIPLENGGYLVTVRQLFDPYASEEKEEEGADFELVFEKTDQVISEIEGVYWWDEN